MKWGFFPIVSFSRFMVKMNLIFSSKSFQSVSSSQKGPLYRLDMETKEFDDDEDDSTGYSDDEFDHGIEEENSKKDL